MRMIRLVAAFVAAGALACAGGGARDGSVAIRVSGVASAPSITRVTVEVQPPGTTFDLVKEGTGVWTGTLVVPAGTRTLVVRAYADAALVGQGSATVDVVAGQTASALVTVLDVTGPPPALDHGPIIRSLVASKRTLAPGEHATLTVDALDPDGDPLSYQWSETCPSGTFGSPGVAQTEWWSDAEAGCTITVQVTARTFTASESILLLVQGTAPAGQVTVSTEFVPQPYIDSIEVEGFKAPDPYWGYYISRTLDAYCTTCFVTSNATLPMTIPPTWRQPLYVQHRNVPNSFPPDLRVWMDDDCGGTVEWDGNLSSGEALYFWNAPPTAVGLCMITAHVEYRGLGDSFTIAALVDGCPEDTFEPNDAAETAAELGVLHPPSSELPWMTGGFERTGLRGNDPDWYEFLFNFPGLPTTITAASAGPVPLELWTDDGTTSTLVATGTDTLSFASQVGPTYRLLVNLGAPPDSCGPSYDLRIAPGLP